LRSAVLLVSSLASKELKVRYKRSVLGFSWFLLKPLFLTAVLSVVFTRILRFGGEIRHYPLFLLPGLLVWNCFSSSLSAASTSLLDNVRLIRSARFPRAAPPVSSVIANSVHLLLAMVVLEALLLAFGHFPSPAVPLLLPALVLFLAVTTGLSLMLAVWNVYYRDVALFLEVLLQAWFYASPVIYPADSGLLPGAISTAIRLNPVSGILEIVQSLLYYGRTPPAWAWISLAAWAVALPVLGMLVFRHAEPAVVKEL